MPINFPNSPSPSQLYTYDNKTWEYNGIYWEVYSALTSYVGGTGTTNNIPKWSGVNSLTDSIIYDDGGFVGIGTSSQTYQEILSVQGGDGGIVNNSFNFVGHSSTSIAIADANYRTWASAGGEIAIGSGQPLLNSTGTDNIAIGYAALQTNTSGIENVAVGKNTLSNNQAGQGNLALGYAAGTSVSSGSYNVFIGYNAGDEVTTEDNRLYIANSGGTPLIYGEFDNGIVNINGTLSATTYDNLPGSSSANCFTTFYVTNISGCSPVNVLSPLNVKDGLSVTGTSTFTSQVNFTGGLSASTFSASTYQNLPSFNSVQINGITQFSGDTNNYINFSGINITITSAATNTLVFSAGTGGGGGGVTSVTAGTGLSGNSTTGAITLINTQVQGITGITAGNGITVSTSNNVSTITNGIGVAVMTIQNVENQTTTLANLPELTFSVLSGSTYRFRFVIHYEAFNAATGSRFTLSGAATTFLSYRSMYSLGAGTQTLNPALSSYDSPATANASSTATSGNIAIVEGILRASADGSVVGRFASEAPIGGAFIRAMIGSYVEYQKIA